MNKEFLLPTRLNGLAGTPKHQISQKALVKFGVCRRRMVI
jgi:hypothetical protein